MGQGLLANRAFSHAGKTGFAGQISTGLQAKPGLACQIRFACQTGVRAKPGLAGQTSIVGLGQALRAKPGLAGPNNPANAGETGFADTKLQVGRVFFFWGLCARCHFRHDPHAVDGSDRSAPVLGQMRDSASRWSGRLKPDKACTCPTRPGP